MGNTVLIHISKTIAATVLLCMLLSPAQHGSVSGAVLGANPPDIAPAVIDVESEETVCAETPITEPSYEPSYSEYELDLLARLIHQEAGSDWIPDDVQLWVGSVVLNRVDSELFPDTIHDVIYQSGQYAPAITGSIETPASDRALQNARYLLENGSVLPSGVVFQSCFVQGNGIYTTYADDILQTTTYFCYG